MPLGNSGGSLSPGPGQLIGFRFVPGSHPGNRTPYAPPADDGTANRTPSAWMISSLILARGQILFRIVFSVWVAFGERKWVTFAERRREADAILLDLQMPPALDGFGTLEQLRADPRFAIIPIVALTANAMQSDREKTLAAGFTSYLSKPVTLKALRAELARLLP